MKKVQWISFSFVMLLLGACGGGENSVSETGSSLGNTSPAVESTGGAGTESLGYSAETNHSNTYCTDGKYPDQWEWRPDTTIATPQPATSGTPMIKHIRGGVVIATYAKLSGYRSQPNNTDAHDTSVGPFRRMPYTQMADGDIFELYPAVYEGEDQQIFIGPNVKNDADYTANISYKPKNITIRGITVNGFRPVIKNPSTGASNNNFGQSLIYVGASENVKIENLDIIDSPTGGSIGKAGIYLNGAKDLTLSNVRVSGFKQHQQNGIFGTGGNTGTFLMQGVELANNGGSGGPEHNIYMNASATDANFTVKMQNSWSHGSYYGHLFKSRAQINILEGNYFQGSKSTGSLQGEAYLVDIPEGGSLTARNNIFAKNFSGDFSNGAAITFAVESGTTNHPFDTTRPWALTVEHNTFVAFSRYYDTQNHKVYPFFFKSSAPVPQSANTVRSNVFVGYCPTASQISAGYYGTNHVELDFNAIDTAFRPRNAVPMNGSSIVGTSGYAHKSSELKRTTTAAGARD